MLVALAFGDLVLDARQLRVGLRQRVLEALDLGVDRVGRDAPLVDIDTAAEDVRDADGDAGRGAYTGEPFHVSRAPPSRGGSRQA